MAKLPPLRRILKEDFQDQPWISRLLLPINDFFENVYFGLNNNLTFGENLAGDIRDLVVTGGKFPVDFTPNFFPRKRNKMLLLGSVQENVINPGIIANAVSLQWLNLSDGRIRIENIAGLTNGVEYRVTVLAIPG